MSNQRNQSRGTSSSSGGNNRTKPWNVYFPREYTVRGGTGQSDETRTDFIRVGAAFPLRDKEGFTVEIQLPLTLPPGARLIAMPRTDDQESGR